MIGTLVSVSASWSKPCDVDLVRRFGGFVVDEISGTGELRSRSGSLSIGSFPILFSSTKHHFGHEGCL